MGVYFQIEEYHRPQDLARAIAILSKWGDKARVIAGGTDIVPVRPGVRKSDAIDHLVDITGLGLDTIHTQNDHICVGSAATITQIAASALFRSGPYRALSDAADAHATPTIGNRATIGGNLCNASPCADLAPPLLVLDAVLTAVGPGGERKIPVENFHRGPNYSALNSDEVLRELRIPVGSENTGSSFLKLRRYPAAIDMAVVNVATSLTCDGNYCKVARIALGSVAPIPLRAREAEAVLTGNRLDDEILHKAAATAAREAKPIDDIRATADYRRKMVAVLVQRSLEISLARSVD